MGHEAAITKRKVLDVVEANANAVTDAVEKHNFLARQVQKDVADLRTRVSAASAWAEANESQLKNAIGRIDRQLGALAKQIGQVDHAHDMRLRDVQRHLDAIDAALPPSGFLGRLRWLFFGPSAPASAEYSVSYPFIDNGVMPVNQAQQRAAGSLVNDHGV